MEKDDKVNKPSESGGSGTAEPKEADAPNVTNGAENGTDWVFEVPLRDITYTVTINPEQRIRLASLIRPKPVPNGDELKVLDDHRASVINVWQLVLNWINECVIKHDKNKLDEKEQHAATEPHHWPLDGYDTSDGFLPVSYVVEAVCDYIATIIGRCEAGRPLEWLSPTNNLPAGEVLTSSCLALLEFYGVAAVNPALKNSGVGP